MTRRLRWRWALAATGALTAVAATLPEAENAPEPAAPTNRTARAPDPARTEELAWPAPVRRAAPNSQAVLAPSAEAAWGPPPAPPAPPPLAASKQAPAAAPVAPAWPYTWIGRMEEDGQHKAVLQGERRTHSARAGDTLDGQWRIEAVDETQMTVLWIPGNQRQVLSLRAAP